MKSQNSIDFSRRSDGNITPFHKRNFIANFESSSILLLKKNVLTIKNSFDSKALILWMERMSLAGNSLINIIENKFSLLALSDENIPWRNWIDNILIVSPNLIPFHQVGIL